MTTTPEFPWQQTTRRIKQLMLERDVRTADELSQLAGVNRSTLSLKMTGKRRFRLVDLQAIAKVLGTTVGYLIGETDQVEARDAEADAITPPHPELHRRLVFLGAPEASRALDDGDRSDSSFPATELEAIAVKYGAPIEYLLSFDDPEAADRVEALIEFSRAAQESGVRRTATRSLGELSAAELRALARVMRAH